MASHRVIGKAHRKIDAVAKDWNDAYAKFFGDGQIFDSIYQPGK